MLYLTDGQVIDDVVVLIEKITASYSNHLISVNDCQGSSLYTFFSALHDFGRDDIAVPIVHKYLQDLILQSAKVAKINVDPKALPSFLFNRAACTA